MFLKRRNGRGPISIGIEISTHCMTIVALQSSRLWSLKARDFKLISAQYKILDRSLFAGPYINDMSECAEVLSGFMQTLCQDNRRVATVGVILPPSLILNKQRYFVLEGVSRLGKKRLLNRLLLDELRKLEQLLPNGIYYDYRWSEAASLKHQSQQNLTLRLAACRQENVDRLHELCASCQLQINLLTSTQSVYQSFLNYLLQLSCKSLKKGMMIVVCNDVMHITISDQYHTRSNEILITGDQDDHLINALNQNLRYDHDAEARALPVCYLVGDDGIASAVKQWLTDYLLCDIELEVVAVEDYYTDSDAHAMTQPAVGYLVAWELARCSLNIERRWV